MVALGRLMSRTHMATPRMAVLRDSASSEPLQSALHARSLLQVESRTSSFLIIYLISSATNLPGAAEVSPTSPNLGNTAMVSGEARAARAKAAVARNPRYL
jgi:hypothetical protein